MKDCKKSDESDLSLTSVAELHCDTVF